jgi:hypothetical protein
LWKQWSQKYACDCICDRWLSWDTRCFIYRWHQLLWWFQHELNNRSECNLLWRWCYAIEFDHCFITRLVDIQNICLKFPKQKGSTLDDPLYSSKRNEHHENSRRIGECFQRRSTGLFNRDLKLESSSLDQTNHPEVMLPAWFFNFTCNGGITICYCSSNCSQAILCLGNNLSIFNQLLSLFPKKFKWIDHTLNQNQKFMPIERSKSFWRSQDHSDIMNLISFIHLMKGISISTSRSIISNCRVKNLRQKRSNTQ